MTRAEYAAELDAQAAALEPKREALKLEAERRDEAHRTNWDEFLAVDHEYQCLKRAAWCLAEERGARPPKP